ncbi:hypothetical protein [Cereibacter sphaeroides]|uniref:hypothetical protein n=1 Tax=Cereibacter sphaeroides TaxID=1063 RepID=UPI0011C3B687|nr:hypothetical protein [Cereibacter sphaeroides]
MLRARGRHRARRLEEHRALAHYLAGLSAFAFHDPKAMPDFRPAGAPPRAAEAEAAVNVADHERVRGALIGMALRASAA